MLTFDEVKSLKLFDYKAMSFVSSVSNQQNSERNGYNYADLQTLDLSDKILYNEYIDHREV